MLYFVFILSIVSFIGVVYLFLPKKVKKDNLIEDDRYYHFPKLSGYPSIIDIDPGYSLLRDVILSCKGELWGYTVDLDRYSVFNRVYDIKIIDHSGVVSINSRIRIHSDDKVPVLVSFNISGVGGSISYSSVGDDIKLELLEFIWNYCIYPNSVNEFNSNMDHYRLVSGSISRSLVGLNRGRILDNLV